MYTKQVTMISKEITPDNPVHQLIGAQLAGMIMSHMVWNESLQRNLLPSKRKELSMALGILANIELSRHYVPEKMTDKRHFDLLEFGITTFGSADFIDDQMKMVVRQN